MVSNNEQDLENEVESPVAESTSAATDTVKTGKATGAENRSHTTNTPITKRLQRFWQEAMVEWKKITFPDSTPPWKMKAGQWSSTNKGELYKLTMGVFVVSAVVAVIVGVLDIVTGLAYKGLINLFTIFTK